MELGEGEDLSTLIAHGAIPMAEALPTRVRSRRPSKPRTRIEELKTRAPAGKK
jgi:hypothetical protein